MPGPVVDAWDAALLARARTPLTAHQTALAPACGSRDAWIAPVMSTLPWPVERWEDQRAAWPASGRHVLANFDAETIVVYQAYRPAIGLHAAAHGRFGGEFSFERMSWIKPNFLWMMYRSGWGTKEGQEVVLAIRIRRSAFDALLAAAVHSSYEPGLYADRADWQARVRDSEVRLQWDPDHDPGGQPLRRRALQLGLRGATLCSYATEPVEVTDISAFVQARRGRRADLLLPLERVYPVPDPAVARHLGLDTA